MTMNQTGVFSMNKSAVYFVAAIVGVFALMMVINATAGGMPWEGPLETLKRSLEGPVAGGIALLALVGAGAALVFSEDISGFIRKMLYLVLAVAVLVLASKLLSALGLTTSSGGMILPALGL